MDAIRFYRARGEYGFLSNLWPCDLAVGGTSFTSAEHAYQWEKAGKGEIRTWIRDAPHPRLAAVAGHGLSRYDIVKDWKARKVTCMRTIVREKFLQNPELARKLLATGDAPLVEASKWDRFWGEGMNGEGRNMLGQILMDVRSELFRVEAD